MSVSSIYTCWWSNAVHIDLLFISIRSWNYPNICTRVSKVSSYFEVFLHTTWHNFSFQHLAAAQSYFAAWENFSYGRAAAQTQRAEPIQTLCAPDRTNHTAKQVIFLKIHQSGASVSHFRTNGVLLCRALGRDEQPYARLIPQHYGRRPKWTYRHTGKERDGNFDIFPQKQTTSAHKSTDKT